MLPSLLVAIGGALGALGRYGIGQVVQAGNLPVATLLVNVTGSFLIGVIWATFDESQWFQDWGKYLITVGMLGGFTTFSSFSLETLELIRVGEVWTALGYVISTVIICVLGVFIGAKLGSFIN